MARYRAQVSLNNDKVHLRSGHFCVHSDGRCLDPIDGFTFWSPLPEDQCHYDSYNVIYEGKATKLTDPTIPGLKTVYTLVSDEVTFALAIKSIEKVCGYEILRSEHNKLMIHETRTGSLFKRKPKSVHNLDIFAYVNSKFVYIEKHIRTQMKDLYRDLVLQRCHLERETIKNSLAIATQSPDEFGLHLMKSPGHVAFLAGEAIHIIKCVAVQVKVDQGEECYSQLQVKWNNETWFLTPRTHILIKRGTQIGCNAAIPAYYQLDGVWYRVMPRLVESTAPQIISPIINATWTYKSPGSLATSGIYSDKDLDQLRDHINFPMERPSLLDVLARNLVGRPTAYKGGSLFNMIDEESLAKLADGTWTRIWTKFLTFGTASAGIIAILMILHIFKLIIDTIIRGYTLHSIYGWSIHVLGAVFSSITALLIHLGMSTEEEKKNDDAENPSDSKSPVQDTITLAPAPRYTSVYPPVTNQTPKENPQFLSYN